MALFNKLTRIYHFEGITAFEPKVVIERIFWVLNDRDYRTITSNENLIEFDDHSGKMKWRGAPVQLEEGSFAIAVSDNIATVKLTYSISFTTYLLMFTVFSVFSIIVDCGSLFLSAFVVIFSIVDFFRLKNEAKELFLNATDGDVIQPI